MSMRLLTLLSFTLISCKTTPAKVESSPSELAATAAPACIETCAGTFASAKILGCVEACDQWIGKSIHVTAGRSLYSGLPSAHRCSFTYEKRNANQVHRGSFHQLFSFGFRYTDGIGDGDFLITGSGMADPAALIDFTKASDEKIFNQDVHGNATTVTFKRADPAQGQAPTLKIEEIDAVDQESKTLIIVLNNSFDPGRPFVATQVAYFKAVVRGQAKHDISCAL